MIGADTMIYHPVRAATYAPKISRTQFGLIAGAGLSDLTNAVATRLALDRTENLAQVAEKIRSEVRAFQGPTHLPGGIDVRDHTVFLLTSPDAVNRNVHLHWGTPENGYDLLPVALGQGFPVLPLDAPPNAFEEMGRRLADACRVAPSADGDEFAASIRYHSELIGAQLAWIAAQSQMVSHEFQVAIHTPTGVRISRVMQTPDEPPEFE
jgi:hypothetical protein